MADNERVQFEEAPQDAKAQEDSSVEPCVDDSTPQENQLADVASNTPTTEERILSGEIAKQKAWQFIKEFNSSEEQLDAVAFKDGNRTYTYRQFFRMWDTYAEVFSGLGITQANGSRVCIVTTISVAPIAAMYALNMMGVSVSMASHAECMVEKWLRNVVKAEGITDVLLPDTLVRPHILHALMKRRDRLGLRHVIIVRTGKLAARATKKERDLLRRNYHQLKAFPGVLFFSDLKREYAATPIAYGNGELDSAAVIVHTSGTTKGTRKPIPLSDDAINTAALRLLTDERFSSMRGNAVTTLSTEISHAYMLVNQIHLPLACGCAIAMFYSPLGFFCDLSSFAGQFKKMDVSVVFLALMFLDEFEEAVRKKEYDLTSVKLVVFGGSAISEKRLKRIRKVFAKYGSNPPIIYGYGLSECGAANLISTYDGTYRGIGRPLAGVSVRIYDEDEQKFYSLEDGSHEGTLYLSSESNSCGRIGNTTFFEPEIIDGVPYICTYDKVRVSEEGDIYHLGRANRYFVNNDGLRFDAGLLESALLAENGIDECAIVPAYEKRIVQDTVPVLLVTTDSAKRQAKTVRTALRNIYIKDDKFEGMNLPWLCIVVDELPHNDMGKVAVGKIDLEKTKGQDYSIKPVEKNGKLVDVRLVQTSQKERMRGRLSAVGVPRKFQSKQAEYGRNLLLLTAPLADEFAKGHTKLGRPNPHMFVGDMSDIMQMQDDFTPWVTQANNGSSLLRAVPLCLKVMQAVGDRADDEPKKKSGKKSGKKSKKKSRKRQKSKGLAFPEPVNTVMRVTFRASDVDYTYEE